jgi:hypothetical protein
MNIGNIAQLIAFEAEANRIEFDMNPNYVLFHLNDFMNSVRSNRTRKDIKILKKKSGFGSVRCFVRTVFLLAHLLQ